MHGAGGPVHVHSVLLVEMFFYILVCFSCKIVMIFFSYFPAKTYVVGAQKNQLNETVLLSTQNTCFNLLISYPFIYLESSKIHKYLISYAIYDVIVSILTPLYFYTYKFFSVY